MTSVTVESDGTDEPPPVGTEGLAVTGEEPVGPAEVDSTVVVSTAGDVSPAGVVSLAGVVSVTGHTVVLIGIVEVTTEVESAGQLVTVGAQLVMVISLVE